MEIFAPIARRCEVRERSAEPTIPPSWPPGTWGPRTVRKKFEISALAGWARVLGVGWQKSTVKPRSGLPRGRKRKDAHCALLVIRRDTTRPAVLGDHGDADGATQLVCLEGRGPILLCVAPAVRPLHMLACRRISPSSPRKSNASLQLRRLHCFGTPSRRAGVTSSLHGIADGRTATMRLAEG